MACKIIKVIQTKAGKAIAQNLKKKFKTNQIDNNLNYSRIQKTKNT